MRIGLILSILFIALTVLPLNSIRSHAQIELVENGSFETGNFDGWTAVRETELDADWFVYTQGEIGILPPPPVGNFAAATEYFEQNSLVLYQDIDVPNSSSVTCSVILYYVNSAFDWVNAPTLSVETFPNQQARIDIMNPDAPVFDVGDGVLLNLFQTGPGDPFSLGYTPLEFDLTQFAGSTVRFRTAVVQNIFVINFAIDDLTCEAEDILRPIPTLSGWGLIATAAVLGLIAVMAIRRRKASV